MSTARDGQTPGHRMALLDDKRSYLDSDQFSHREKIALRYCDAIMGNPLDADDALWALLHEEFTEAEPVELGHWIGFISGGQRWLMTLQIGHGEFAESLAWKPAGAVTPAVPAERPSLPP